MKMLQTGDACPICGQPIRTKDPNKLIFLSAMAWWAACPVGAGDLCDGDGAEAAPIDRIRSLPDAALADLIGRLAECGYARGAEEKT